jgi:hypothetical protein
MSLMTAVTMLWPANKYGKSGPTMDVRVPTHTSPVQYGTNTRVKFAKGFTEVLPEHRFPSSSKVGVQYLHAWTLVRGGGGGGGGGGGVILVGVVRVHVCVLLGG